MPAVIVSDLTVCRDCCHSKMCTPTSSHMCELKRLHMWNVVAKQNNTNPVFMYDFPGKCLIYPLVFNIIGFFGLSYY
jgi:hypothetical protein